MLFKLLFKQCMLKKGAWLSFVKAMNNFLGNKKTNCEDFAG